MGTTSTFGWRFPNLADPANASANFSTALGDVENTVKDTTIQTYTPAWTSDGDTQPSGGTRTGWYRVDNGICHFAIRLTGDGSNGGTGGLTLSVPLTPNASIPRQIMPAEIYVPYAGAGQYLGHAMVTNVNGTQLLVYFPASSSDTRLSNWRNATNGNGAGTGIPLIPSWYGMIAGAEVVISGSYFL